MKKNALKISICLSGINMLRENTKETSKSILGQNSTHTWYDILFLSVFPLPSFSSFTSCHCLIFLFILVQSGHFLQLAYCVSYVPSLIKQDMMRCALLVVIHLWTFWTARYFFVTLGGCLNYSACFGKHHECSLFDCEICMNYPYLLTSTQHVS